MEPNKTPLAERARPTQINDIVGQTHLLSQNGIIRNMLENQDIRSCIFYGPPGCGKSCTAKVIAHNSGMPFVYLNATTTTSKILKDEIDKANGNLLIYLDEIQYFNKKQQQVLLSYVEDGSVILIAATTENPYHGIYKALLSRCLVLEFKPLNDTDIENRLYTICKKENITIGQPGIDQKAIKRISEVAAGDMRRAINILDAITTTYNIIGQNALDSVTTKEIDKLLPSNIMGSFDTDGDQHYRYKAALQKSIRGSDPSAAVFWLMQMLEGGDIISPSRRMLIMASEDVGLADPLAVTVVLSCVEAAERVGLPEARFPLAQAAIYLATAPKSNSIGKAFGAAVDDIHKGHGTIVPEHIASEHPKNYIYPHNYPLHWVNQQYMPDDLIGKKYWVAQENQSEQARAKYWENIIKRRMQNS